MVTSSSSCACRLSQPAPATCSAAWSESCARTCVHLCVKCSIASRDTWRTLLRTLPQRGPRAPARLGGLGGLRSRPWERSYRPLTTGTAYSRLWCLYSCRLVPPGWPLWLLAWKVILMLQHSTSWHSTAQRSTAQRSASQHSTAPHSTAQHYCIIQDCTMPLLQTLR